jgi:endonuclease G
VDKQLQLIRTKNKRYQAIRCAILTLLTIALVASEYSIALAEDKCADKFYGGKPPVIETSTISTVIHQICYLEFALGFSGDTKTPLWSAEHLTATQVSVEIPRRGEFHVEESLSPRDRSDLADYRGSGFDRGHMSPSGDEDSWTAQIQTFSLANVVPQAPGLNRGIWQDFEDIARALAERDGEVYVVTGPIFAKVSQYLNGRVRVPAEIFKAIYDPSTGLVGAYVAQNDSSGRHFQVSIDQLFKLSGIDVFPGLIDAAKAADSELPLPARIR